MCLLAPLDEDWLDKEGVESFLDLASMGIKDELESPESVPDWPAPLAAVLL